MNKILLCLLLWCCINTGYAQKRHISFKTINRDTVSLPLTSDYFLIEDECAEITRYTRYDFHNGKFYGGFKDISTASPKIILAEGEYTPEGLKTGLFTVHYANGKLRATGIFKDNNYDGRWEMFYENGKPEITFEVVNGDVRIINVWGADGLKTVDNGNGDYTAKLGQIYWKGKLVNGKPDGKWHLYNTGDTGNSPIVEERFKKGIFHDGSSVGLDYQDATRIKLIDPNKLPLVNLEHFYVSPAPCSGKGILHVVDASYKGGMEAFSKKISDEVGPYLSQKDLQGVNSTIEIDGEVSETGQLINLENGGVFGDFIVRKIIARLAHFPLLIPATVDGKPVKQKFKISFQIYNLAYRYSYQFLPVDTGN